MKYLHVDENDKKLNLDEAVLFTVPDENGAYFFEMPDGGVYLGWWKEGAFV